MSDFRRGEESMRERAARTMCKSCEKDDAPILTEQGIYVHYSKIAGHICYASGIRSLPLSVADGPAPAKEPDVERAYLTGEPLFPAPSPPTAEEGVEKDWTFPAGAKPLPPPTERQLKRAQLREKERAALLACREALRGLLADIEEYQTINHLGGHDNHWQVASRKALAAADAVVR